MPAPRLTRRNLLALLGLVGAVAGCSDGSTAQTSATQSPAATTAKASMQTIRYGTDPSQYGELHLPASPAAKLPVVVVVHGGYWGSAYGLELGVPLAKDLAAHGVAAWNIEYRRIGIGGGWPGTFDDVAAAMDALAGKVKAAADGLLDLSKVVVVGHSAGGHIAGWLAGRHKLAAGAVGASPAVRPIGYVSQAGVLDLVAAEQQGLGGGAVDGLMGGSPKKYPERYAVGSPYALLPLGVPGTLVHGLADDIVPISQSDTFAARAKQLGDAVTEVRMPGVDHFMLIDPTTPAWAECRKAALGYLGVT
ncbi:alpha/beta fold hydrolase [Acidothermaceae bacterium B102]|nr:alpha/beta fold hydrolase [Acidothermaceae bacterium B102]